MTTVLATRPSLGPEGVRLLESIRRSGRAVVTLRRDDALFNSFEPHSRRMVLKRLTDGDWLRRIERGVYAVSSSRGIEVRSQLALVADWLDGEDYVVAGFFALAHWNLTGHPPSTVDLLMPRRRPNVRYGPTLFRFVYMPTERLPTHREVRVAGARALARVITPERALLDVLSGRHAVDFASAGEAFNRGLRFGVLNRRRLVQAAREAPATAARRLGWIAEQAGDPLADALDPLVGNGGYVALDPKLDQTDAQRSVRWRVFENARIA